MDTLEEFLSVIYEKNVMHSKYLKNFLPYLTASEVDDLKLLIKFYQSLGHSIDDIAGCYLQFIQDVIEETMYFNRHGTYRYSTFKEVADDVYFNGQYMTTYMIGLGLSTYLLNNHLDNMRYFIDFIKNASGKKYLEIGPGHGEYFVKAMKYSRLNYFHAVDLSETSVNLTNNYVKFCNGGGGGITFNVEQRDFLDFQSENKYDVIVTGEVLEHVEQPKIFLEKIAGLLDVEGRSYVTTVVDAPARDHIYHFHNPEEIFDIAKAAGLNVIDYKLITYNHKPIEKVRKKHESIIVSMILGV